jgi:ubiquinone/menaquinone biosynthesis C-methylase UbiE
MESRRRRTKSGQPQDDSYARMLALSDLLREASIRSAIGILDLPEGSRGLDAGCGIGSHTLLLAEVVGARGHVTGLDRSAALLARARERARDAGLSVRVGFQEGDIHRLRFGDGCFDWVWSVDCAGYAPGEPVALLKELARVVRPGGCVAILGWTSQQLLPGYPELEARLNATRKGIAPFSTGSPPEEHFLRALGWFGRAGLREAKVRTFAGDVHAPLSHDKREALVALIQMRWGDPRPELSTQDALEFERLCTPGSPDFIIDLADYYAFFTYSMFWGRVPR